MSMFERSSGPGRLDMLICDAEANTWFKVELQLGATNEAAIQTAVAALRHFGLI